MMVVAVFNNGSFVFYSGPCGMCTIRWMSRSLLSTTSALLTVVFKKVSFGLFSGFGSACTVGLSNEIGGHVFLSLYGNRGSSLCLCRVGPNSTTTSIWLFRWLGLTSRYEWSNIIFFSAPWFLCGQRRWHFPVTYVNTTLSFRWRLRTPAVPITTRHRHVRHRGGGWFS